MPIPNYRLLTPGPTPVPEESLLCLAKQVRHHRTTEFTEILQRVIRNLQTVFMTANPIAVLQGSGTSAMEACVSNVIQPGDQALILHSGKFAERWTELVERFGGKAIRYELPWGEVYSGEGVAAYLRQYPHIKAVYATLVETSTGTQHDIKGIGRVVAQSGALLVVDGISGVGAVRCKTDKWGIDLLAVGSQKALMTPPGLAFVSISQKALNVISSNRQRSCYYLDLIPYINWEKTQGAPFTPARSLIEALDSSLQILLESSMEEIWDRTRLMANMVRGAVIQWNTYVPDIKIVSRNPSDSLTVIHLPLTFSVKDILANLEFGFGIKIAGAQGDWKGKAIRISHMGMINPTDILAVISALDIIFSDQLDALGQGIELYGVGATTAQYVCVGKM